MKRVSFFVVAAGFVVISALVARTAMTDGPNADAAAAKAKLADLHKQRIATLERIVDLRTKQSEILPGGFEALAKAKEDLIKAKLDATDKPEERIELLKERVTIAQDVCDYLKQQRSVGFQATDLEFERANAHRLKVEIRLQEELAK